MKKRLLAIGMLCGVLLTGCGNYQNVDLVLTYDRAIIRLANDEVIEVEVSKWKDYDGKQIQIVAKDGTVYLVSSVNCTLIRD